MQPRLRSASVRDLRNNFAQVSAWLRAGQEVEITRRGEVMAELIPAGPSRKPAKRDLEARMKKLKAIYGGKSLPGNSVVLMREDKDW